VTTSTQCHSKE